MKLDTSDFVALSRELLSRGHAIEFRVLGGSMLPCIRNGSLIRVKPVDPQDLRLGDVIFYYNDTPNIVAHRLIGKYQSQGRLKLLARGDSLPRSAVEEVEPEQVLGRVVAAQWGKGLTIRLDTAWGRALGIVLAGISPLVRKIYQGLSKPEQTCRRSYP